jgi:hypothetical protein
MPTKRKPGASRPSRADRALEQADFKTWLAAAMAELQREHNVNPAIIPVRVWAAPVYPGPLSAGCRRSGRSIRPQHTVGRRSAAEAMRHGRHTALAPRALGMAASSGQTSAAERERCAAVVERWNAAPTHDWSPAIGTALKAGYRWLDVYCGGWRQMKPIDLAAVDIHPHACLTSLILSLRCRQCGGHGPLPKLIGSSRFLPVVAKSGS